MRTYQPRPRPDRTPRMRRAARMRDRGLSTRQIAARIGVSHDTVWRDLARWDTARARPAVRPVTPDSPGYPQAAGQSRLTARPVDAVLPGTVRTEHYEHDVTTVTVRCGRCGHEQDTGAESKTSTCKGCGRTMRLDRAAGENVVPLRRPVAAGRGV